MNKAHVSPQFSRAMFRHGNDQVTEGHLLGQGETVVLSLGRILPGSTVTAQVTGRVSESVGHGSTLRAFGMLRSSTALPVLGHATRTKVVRANPGDDSGSDIEERDDP